MPAARDLRDRATHNNVSLLRVSLALLICVGHAAQLSGEQALEPVTRALSSPYRVSAFFVLSGFLIFGSYERSSSLASYARRRVRRIYPMYACVVLLCAFGLSAASRLPAGEYFSTVWMKHVAANLIFLGFLQPTLPGVFEDNVRPEINGALWTLKIEVMFYLVVPAFAALFVRAGRFRVMAAAYLSSIGYVTVMTMLASRRADGIFDELARQLPGQIAFLMAGACAYYYLPVVERRVRSITVGAITALMLNPYMPLAILEPLALAAIVMVLALFTPVVRMDPTRSVSYALFLVHFPIAQVVTHTAWLKGAPFLYLTSVTLLSVAAATLLDGTARRFVLRPTMANLPVTTAQAAA